MIHDKKKRGNLPNDELEKKLEVDLSALVRCNARLNVGVSKDFDGMQVDIGCSIGYYETVLTVYKKRTPKD